MQTEHPAIPNNPALTLGISKVAKSMDVSPRTVWSWILEKKLPSVVIGRRRLVLLTDLERFIEAHRQ